MRPKMKPTKTLYQETRSANHSLVSKVVSYRTIPLLTTNLKTRKLAGVNRKIMEEALMSLSIAPKILARRSNATWDILLATITETKVLAEGILTTKPLRLQIEYLDTQKTKITLHGVPLDIEHWGALFAHYGQVGNILMAKVKASIVIGEVLLQCPASDSVAYDGAQQ